MGKCARCGKKNLYLEAGICMPWQLQHVDSAVLITDKHPVYRNMDKVLPHETIKEDEAETMEEVFAQARNAEATAEDLLVDEGWKLVEVEPETTGVNGNGHHVNRHDDLFGIGPMVELVPVNGHAPAKGNGNGHHEEADEPQRSLFSWAEFMAEPVKPKGRKSKPRPASISMFEWALEQEREREPVGAGS